MTNLLHATHHAPGENVQRYVNSFAHDLVHAVSRGQFLTEKHALLGTGLHSLTGLKKPIEILGRFGHSCNYDQVRLIETAQAEVAQHLRELQNALPLFPRNGTDSVLTFFWWDNFDVKKENSQGSLHTTHGIAYHEESNQSVELVVTSPSQADELFLINPSICLRGKLCLTRTQSPLVVLSKKNEVQIKPMPIGSSFYGD